MDAFSIAAFYFQRDIAIKIRINISDG